MGRERTLLGLSTFVPDSETHLGHPTKGAMKKGRTSKSQEITTSHSPWVAIHAGGGGFEGAPCHTHSRKGDEPHHPVLFGPGRI